MTSVPPVPELAVTLADVALHDEDCDDGDTGTCGRWNASIPGGYDRRRHVGYYEDRARKALEVAAAAIRADERERLNRDPVTEHARQFLDSDEMTELVRADPPCSRDDAMTAIGALIGVTRMLLKLIEGDSCTT